MTIEQVKLQLPEVVIEFDGKRMVGRVSGRINEYATVTTNNGASFQFAWPTVARAVTENRVLRV